MENFEPEIVAFCCHYCAYTAADMAGSKRISYPANVKIIRVPCTGKVDAIHIMKAFEKGADGVYVAGCLEGDCHFKNGNTHEGFDEGEVLGNKYYGELIETTRENEA